MISGVGSNLASTWASNLFNKLDTKNQGYIEKSDLATAFESIADSTSNVDEIFTQLDGDSDGKVTKDELTTALQSIADELDSQFNQMRMHGPGGQGGPEGMPPPPLPENDTGFTQEELESQLSEIGDSDSKRASLISNIVENFDEADSDGDGRVTFQEAMAYDQASGNAAMTSSSSAGSDTVTSQTSESEVMRQILQLMQAYQVFGREDDGLTSLINASA